MQVVRDRGASESKDKTYRAERRSELPAKNLPSHWLRGMLGAAITIGNTLTEATNQHALNNSRTAVIRDHLVSPDVKPIA
jgi:hypothetical protein